MERVTAALRDFFVRHNIDPEGVRMDISFPDERAYQAKDCWLMDTNTWKLSKTLQFCSYGEAMIINGVNVRFRHGPILKTVETWEF